MTACCSAQPTTKTSATCSPHSVDAGLAAGAPLPSLQLRLHADDGSTVQVDWRPDLDDAALLRSALLFAEAPALTLAMPGEPTLHAFCGAADPAAAQRVPAPLAPTGAHPASTARDALDRGLTPATLANAGPTPGPRCRRTRSCRRRRNR